MRFSNNTSCRRDRDARAKAALAVLLVALCALFGSAVHAQARAAADEVYDFDIPRTTRVQALQELSRQAGGLLLGYLSNDTAEEQALVGPVKGKQTIEDVLRVILRSAMLTFRWVEKDILSVEPIRIKESAAIEGELLRWAEERWREEIMVISWPIRDLALSVAPVTLLDRDRIDAIGAPTLAEALRYVSQSAYTRPEGYRASGAQYAEMRGLGPDTALVLINGRRTLPSANSLTSSAFDLNTIPITAVERVELLFDSGAATHGTDAIGGIINIVLRKQVPDPTLDFRYGAADGGAKQRRATFSVGADGGDFEGALILDYFDLGGLEGSDRALWRDQDYGRFGGSDHRSRISSIGNISSAAGGALPGLSSPIAAVPPVDATPGASTEDFVATAGTSNLESLFRYWSIVPESTRTSVVGTGSFDFTDRVTASAEVLYVNRDTTFYLYPPALSNVPVPAGNAYNPFGATVLASRLLPELGQQHRFIESDLRRVVAGLEGKWGAWYWELSALHSEEEATTWMHNDLDLRPNGALMRALASSDPAQALNLFQSGPVNSAELLRSLLASRSVDEFASAGTQVAGYLRGPLWRLRATVGGELRQESAEFSSAQSSFNEDRDITSAFVQLELPLMQELSLSAGGRWDDYDTIGSGTRSQFGAQWKPRPYLTVRASTGRSFRPPSLYELYLPQINMVASVSDPARNYEATTVRISVGGNPELQPVTAKTVTAGIAFTPDTAMNWKLSADYWRITMKDRVLLLPASLLLAHEDLFPGRIVRADPTEPDRPGVVQTIDGSRINVGHVQASGVDFVIRSDLQTDAGRFTPELLATWFDTYDAADIPGEPALDRVNLTNELGTILEWRAILSLGWKRGPYGILASARYTPSYDDAIAGVRVGRKVASQTLFDLQGSLDFSRLLGASSPWAGSKLIAGATNLFDEEPSFAIGGGLSGFDMSQGDLKQRSYYLRLQKQF